uniref:Uncharacterized protein n=1 Tax=Glycine max TaxID=3847 RepID=C6TD11_SOYBN|nr:unknown [Glycine max]
MQGLCGHSCQQFTPTTSRIATKQRPYSNLNPWFVLYSVSRFVGLG